MTKFRVTSEHLYSWPVVINPPDPDRPGEVLEQKFNMVFRAQPRDEARAMKDAIDAMPADEQSLHQDDLLRSVCRGWDDQVIGDNELPLPFTPETFEMVLQLPWNRIGLYRGYSESTIGQAAKKGN